MNLSIDKSWTPFLGQEFDLPYMLDLLDLLKREKAKGQKIYPEESRIFEAFKLTPFEKVKVVIIGQDPYHGEGQAHGLCFSVGQGIKHPPSLINIFKELRSDLNIDLPAHGQLDNWARQGVLLLNTVLTVEDGKAGSHHNKGWERFTDKVIEVLNKEKDHLVFILWGNPAQKKAQRVSPEKHLILKSVHPSPLSVYRGFLGSKPFSQANAYLAKHGELPVDWRLT